MSNLCDQTLPHVNKSLVNLPRLLIYEDYLDLKESIQDLKCQGDSILGKSRLGVRTKVSRLGCHSSVDMKIFKASVFSRLLEPA